MSGRKVESGEMFGVTVMSVFLCASAALSFVFLVMFSYTPRWNTLVAGLGFSLVAAYLTWLLSPVIPAVVAAIRRSVSRIP